MTHRKTLTLISPTASGADTARRRRSILTGLWVSTLLLTAALAADDTVSGADVAAGRHALGDMMDSVVSHANMAARIPNIDCQLMQAARPSRFTLPSVTVTMGDIESAAALGPGIGERILSQPDNIVLPVHLAYRLLGASAGGYGPPLPGRPPSPRDTVEWADGNLGLSTGPDSQSVGSSDDWKRAPLGWRRSVIKVLMAVEESSPYFAEALSAAAGSPLSTMRSLPADSIYAELSAPWQTTGARTPRRSCDAIADVNLSSLSCGTRILMERLQALVAELKVPDQQPGLDSWSCTLNTAYGHVGLFGTGPDTIRGQFAVVVDFGGDDVYRLQENSSPWDKPVRVIIDVEGNDTYEDSTGRSLACGLLGAGVLLDLEGNDVYTSGESGLGSAFYGTGLLIDLAGNDHYVNSGKWGQGAAHVGVGMLLDRRGDDIYECVRESQGFGATCGVGALIDVSGNDRYLATAPGSGFVQGAARGRWAEAGDGQSLSGGCGLLIDGSGDDFYQAVSWCQGSGYWWSMGCLYDRAGNDRYTSATYALGAAAHLGVGAAVDASGDDNYNTASDIVVSGQMQGYGRDGSLGLFIDFAGSDHYTHSGRCAGVGDMHGIGLFWDCAGADYYAFGADSRFAGDPSYGTVIRDWPQMLESLLLIPESAVTCGLFLDSGGDDEYRFLSGDEANGLNRKHPRNNATWLDLSDTSFIGVGIDAEMLFKRLPIPSGPGTESETF